MRLTYFGHCAFRWETPGGVTAVADPYRNQSGRYWFTRLFPHVRCDLGLITHAHFDHDAVERLPEAASILRMPGEFSTGDCGSRACSLHSGASRLRDFPNVMFRLEAGGLSFLHIGDNRVEWPVDVASAVGDVDVLLVTVDDSNHLLTYEQVDSLVQRLQPKVVIPNTMPSLPDRFRRRNCARDVASDPPDTVPYASNTGPGRFSSGFAARKRRSGCLTAAISV